MFPDCVNMNCNVEMIARVLLEYAYYLFIIDEPFYHSLSLSHGRLKLCFDFAATRHS